MSTAPHKERIRDPTRGTGTVTTMATPAMTDQPRERPPVPPWWEPYAAEFPWWQAWRGTSGLLYARKLETIPPVVVRAEDPTGLREQIRQAEAR